MDKKTEMSIYERTCMQRIQQLISDYCGGSQQRFVEKTGLCKASISQYVNGKNIPSTANAEKIAKAFNVDPAWILGYDVIPPGVDEDLSAEARELYDQYKRLSPENQIAFRTLLRSLQSDS